MSDFRRRIMAGISNPNPIPPTGVVWYKKLVFDGTAYLNTGLNVQNKTFEWTVTWERRATSNDYGVVEKYNYNGGSNRDMQIYVRQYNNPNNSYSLYSNSSSVVLPVVVPLNTKVTFTVARVAGANHYTLTADGQTINGPTTTRDRTEPLCITKSAKAVMSSEVKIDGVVIQYLRPCTYYGEPGMWDTINNAFIGNAASSGSFSVEN